MKVAHWIDHRGINRTLETAKCLFKYLDLDIPNDARGSVIDYIQKCITRLKLRREAKRVPLPINSLHYDKPIMRIQMDFLEGLGPTYKEETSRKKNAEVIPPPNSLFIIVCAFTRYVKLYSTYDKTSDTVGRCLHNLYCTMGIPGCHISDGALAFTSHELEAFLNA